MLTREELHARFRSVRDRTTKLCAPLAIEDWVVQSMEDASPVKWNVAHTTWFFETFVLCPHLAGYRAHDPRYAQLFNSYYESVGPRFARAHRGVLSRPTVAEVVAWRARVDAAVHDLVERADDALFAAIAPLVEIGAHHEEQHQELLLTDLAHALAQNPLDPAYLSSPPRRDRAAPTDADAFIAYDAGVVRLGHDGDVFAFDNERPAHRVFTEPFRLARHLVTNRAYVAFVEDGGYTRPELWLSDGWAAVQARGWDAPLHYRREPGGSYTSITLRGREPLDLDAPVCHVSHYEADAFARWAKKRLPTEAEWERAACEAPAPAGDEARGTLLDDGDLHPVGRAARGDGPLHMIGEVWEWTASAYLPYPGYRVPEGALGEYNGKFMSGQMVLRGASAFTPRSHVRITYRNFFQPDKRWQLSGIRLADD